MKRAFIATLQILVSIALIIWIFHDPGKRALMADALAAANLWWLVPGVTAMGIALAAQAARWQVLLRAVDVHFHWLRTTQLYFIGAFFNLFLLGATGGDVAKIYYAVRESPDARAAAFLSIVVDRVMGLIALAAIAVIAVASRFDVLMSTPIAQGMLATLALILAAGLGVVVVGALVAFFKLQARLPANLPARTAIVDLAVATERYARAPRALFGAFALSIAGHLLMFATFYFAARALGSALTMLDTFSVMPIVSAITAVPISLSGIGLREQIFEQLLSTLYAIPASEAVLISLLGYLTMVIWSLVGGLVYLTYRRPTDAVTIPKMDAVAEDLAERPNPAA
ncbi:MAG: lysylphosphatidylglycerol synthase transmembrane domain-containing protein [Chthoniobacterales bacterium]